VFGDAPQAVPITRKMAATMDTSAPEPLKQWIRSVEDPWDACERADWFIYVARNRGCAARHVVRALARNMPPLQGPPKLGEMSEPLRELIAACASGEPPSPALEAQIKANVRPRLIDWNVALQYHGPSVPEGVPRRATPSEEPVRAWANAALRLQKGLDLDATKDEPWVVLVLVAQYIVFDRAGSGLNPLHNHVEADARSTREVEAHRQVCDALRTELSTMGGV
jgi:hypothetical protein